MKKRINTVLLIVVVICCTLLIPVLVYKYLENNANGLFDHAAFISFFGSYFGALFSAMISLIGIALTIRFTRNQNREDKELQIRPYFDIKYFPESNQQRPKTDGILGYLTINSYENDHTELNETGLLFLYLKNVGLGSAINIEFEINTDDHRIRRKIYYKTWNYSVTTSSLQPGENACIAVCDYNNAIAPKYEDLLYKDNRTVATYDTEKFKMPLGFKFIAKLKYNDLLNNKFVQLIHFRINYSFMYPAENSSSHSNERDKIEPHYISNIAIEKIEAPLKENE